MECDSEHSDSERDSEDVDDESDSERVEAAHLEEESENEMNSGDEGDESESKEESSEGSEDDDKSKANPGWADALQKILKSKKPKRKKSIVLSKAKRLCDVVVKVQEERASFAVEGSDGTIKKEVLKTEVKVEQEGESTSGHRKQKRRDTGLGVRVKPSVLDRERERILQKIATK